MSLKECRKALPRSFALSTGSLTLSIILTFPLSSAGSIITSSRYSSGSRSICSNACVCVTLSDSIRLYRSEAALCFSIVFGAFVGFAFGGGGSDCFLLVSF